MPTLPATFPCDAHPASPRLLRRGGGPRRVAAGGTGMRRRLVGALVAAGWCAATAPSPVFGHGALHDRIAVLEARLASTAGADAAARHALAELFVEHGEWARALAEADRVEALRPGAFSTARLRGAALLGLGRPDEALAACDVALARDRHDRAARADRARALRRLGREAAALDEFRAVWRATQRPALEFTVEFADALAVAGQAGEASVVLEAGLAALGSEPALLKAALDLDLAAGRTDAALARVAALAAGAPRAEPWLARRAEILAAAGRTDEARAAWRQLADRIAALPNLERGQPAVRACAEQAQRALAADSVRPARVAAAPAAPSFSPTSP